MNLSLKHEAVPILALAVLALGPVALVARAQAPKGEIRLAPLSVSTARRFEPVEFVFEVRPADGPKGPLEATLTLTSYGGKPRAYPARSTDGKTFRVTAVPSQPDDPGRVRITLAGETSELVFEAPDRSIAAGARVFKLSDVRQIEFGDDPRVITLTGEEFRGAVTGLDSLQAEVGGQSVKVDALKSARLFVTRIADEQPLVSYRIVAKRGAHVVAETSGRIEFKGGLSSPEPAPPVRPARTLAFADPVIYEVPDAADVLLSGDLDGDRRVDLVTGGDENLGVLYGRGNGTFEPYRSLLTWKARVGARVVADMNADRLPEVVFFDNIGRLVTLVNRGGRRFDEPKFQVMAGANRVVAADFNLDGRMDLGRTEREGRGGFAVLLQYPDGIYREEPSMKVGGFADGIAAADVNRDGFWDVALGSGRERGGVGLFFGTASGKFEAGPVFQYGTGNTLGICVEDLTGDGSPEVVGTDYWGGKIMVSVNNRNGTFQPPMPYPAGAHPLQVHVADFDGNGRPDLAVPGARNHVAIFRNRGNGTFHDPLDIASGGENARSCVVGDFNRDGRPDLAIAHERKDATVSVVLNMSGK